MAERLTIKGGNLKFYEKPYTKCSNKDLPEIKKQVKKGVPFYAIKGYQSTSYNDIQLSNIYSKLLQLEDLMEKYGIESLKELDFRLAFKQNDIANYKYISQLGQDRDTWKKACELACEHIANIEWLSVPETDNDANDEIETIKKQNINYFYQQAKEKKDDN